MNICGCLVHVSPERLASAVQAIGAFDGVEVHAQSDDGRLVVVVEDTATRFASEIIMDLHQIPGVISFTLTFHHFEEPSGASHIPPAKGSHPRGDQPHDHV